MSASPLAVTFARVEGQHLADLIDQFQQVLADEAARDDPAVRRLTPGVYPDEPDASDQFAAATQSDLLDRRKHDARTVLAALHAFVDDHSTSGSVEQNDDVEVFIPPHDIDAWLRTFAALRLVLASRLGIETQSDHRPHDPHFGVYDWLGYRLELLLEAANDAEDPL